ncbi:MAG: P1 family peptidase [Trebonia sp.]
MTPPQGRGRARDLGFPVGVLQPGPLNAITDVAGVLVGQTTVRSDAGITARTGVTAIWPHDGNPFRERVYAATSVFNGYGILTSDMVLQEWGLMGAPVVLCDTANLGIVYDACVRYMTEQDGSVGTDDVLMPVVAECDDGFLNDNRAITLTSEHVTGALASATAGPVQEGAVGAGTGTQMFDFKGGIGTASRRIQIGSRTFTVGVLLNTNYGTRPQLQIAGHRLGHQLTGNMPAHHKEGSCIAVVATDIPLHPAQLRRLARRVDIGLGRTGSVGNDGSGEIFLAFSTAQRIPRAATDGIIGIEVMVEGQFWTHGSPFDRIFEAVAEASEEAALNALCQADTTCGRNGNQLSGFPIERALQLMRG